MQKSSALILALVFFVAGAGITMLVSKNNISSQDQAAVILLGKETSSTPVSKMPSSEETVDTFIKNIPTITAALEAASKNPELFKAKIKEGQEDEKFPRFNIDALFGYWDINHTFTTSGAETCFNSYTPANNQVVTQAGPGTCIVWQWVLYPWWQPGWSQQ